MLCVIQQIVNKFPYLESKGYAIHMNHTVLMKAILLYCGLSEEQHSDVLAALLEPKVSVRQLSYSLSCHFHHSPVPPFLDALFCNKLPPLM